MIWLGREDHSFGEKNNRIPLKKLNVGWLNLQFYTCQIQLVDFICILTPVNLLLEVHYTKYRMANPSLSHMPVRLPEAMRNYSITELELCGLAINIANFFHLLKRVDFDAIVDHLSITHIIKGKAAPPTIRIKGLLELISSYSFNLYCMVLSDFLSRQNNDNSKPHEIIPISFNMHKVLEENYHKIGQQDLKPDLVELNSQKLLAWERI